MEERRTEPQLAIVVSNDPEALRIFGEAAAIAGFEHRVSADARAALELVRERDHALLVLDLDHPFDGDALDPAGTLLLLRSDARGRTTPTLTFARVRTPFHHEVAHAYDTHLLASPLSQPEVLERLESGAAR